MQTTIIDTKRPPRWKVKAKKVLRYIISVLPYLLFQHSRMSLYVMKRTEFVAYKLMWKLNLLDNYKK